MARTGGDYPGVSDSAKGGPESRQPPSRPSSSRRGPGNLGGTTATKVAAYSGSEAGSLIGGALGPPIVGSVVGNLIGERVGESLADKTGLRRAGEEARNKIGSVIGDKNVDKMGEITLNALGYGKEETCLCCPCMPASQILLFIMLPFFCFACYRLHLGSWFERHCSEGSTGVRVVEVSPNQTYEGPEETYLEYTKSSEEQQVNPLDSSSSNSSASSSNINLYVSYPCEFGFHYLVAGAAVWVAFLPFYILRLYGTCFRQCCCCTCDPVVWIAMLVDCCLRFCCECKRFNLIRLVWSAMCVFQVVWAIMGLRWLIEIEYFRDNRDFQDFVDCVPKRRLLRVTLAAVILDLMLAGNELLHIAYFELERRKHPPPDDPGLEAAGTGQNAVEMSLVTK